MQRVHGVVDGVSVGSLWVLCGRESEGGDEEEDLHLLGVPYVGAE